jgi:hypothetical protein
MFAMQLKVAGNVWQLPAVGDFWHCSSNISLNFHQAQISNKALNRQLLVGAVCAMYAFHIQTKI